MALKKSDSSKASRVSVPFIAIPKPWLIGITALLILPWLTVFAIWLRPMSWTRANVGYASPLKAAHTGKWGKITLYPIVISPPMELVFTDWGFERRPEWFFPGAGADAVGRMLESAGVPAADAKQQQLKARYEPRISGVVLTPDPSWVRALPQEIRTRIYGILAKSELNGDQARAFRYPGANPDAWLGSDLVSPHTRRLIEPLIYRSGNYMFFSDIELVRSDIGSDEELRRLGKALFRQPTVIARLSIGEKDDLDALVEYWGRGGRRTEIRPLLESVKGNGTDHLIDITHLLPPFVQNHLYTYPELSVADLDKPAVVNCLWTALNFFPPNPNNRYLDADVAVRTLREDYFVVESDFELGDVAAFLDENGNIFHAAVYIADDLWFSKNGISAMAPWTLTSLEDIKNYYRLRSENPRIIVHRRKDQ